MARNLTFVVETRLPLDDDILTTEVTVDYPHGVAYDGLEERLEIMPDLLGEARKNIASRHVTYEAYGNDSAYLDALEKVADGVEIVSVKEKVPEGGKPMRIYFEAEYNDGSIFGEDAWGANVADATFQGAWSMAVSNHHDGKPENLEDLLDFMDVTVLMNYAKPVSEEEMVAMLADLVAAGASGEDLSDMMDKARGMLEAIAANGEQQELQAAAVAGLERVEAAAPATPGM